MAKIKQNTKIDIEDVELSPGELAHIFSIADSTFQAQFFNELSSILNHWEKPFEFQLQHINTESILSYQARELMIKIGEYGPKIEEQ